MFATSNSRSDSTAYLIPSQINSLLASTLPPFIKEMIIVIIFTHGPNVSSAPTSISGFFRSRFFLSAIFWRFFSACRSALVILGRLALPPLSASLATFALSASAAFSFPVCQERKYLRISNGSTYRAFHNSTSTSPETMCELVGRRSHPGARSC